MMDTSLVIDCLHFSIWHIVMPYGEVSISSPSHLKKGWWDTQPLKAIEKTEENFLTIQLILQIERGRVEKNG